jgi:hypothetical protein
MAHEIPYTATATVADLRDLEYKATHLFRSEDRTDVIGSPRARSTSAPT